MDAGFAKAIFGAALVTGIGTTLLNAAAKDAYVVGKSPQGVISDGVNVWVANQTDGTVTKLLASTGAAIGTFPAGLRPAALAFDGTNIWVTNSGGNSVTELLASTGVTVGSYTVGPNPQGIVFDGTNIWVATANYNAATLGPEGALTELLASSGATVATYPVGLRPSGIVFDGANLWVSDTYDGKLRKVSASTGEVAATYGSGAIPLAYAGIAFDGANIWVANSETGTVTKLLAYTGAIVNAYHPGVSLLASPSALAFDGSDIWVADVVAGTVTELLASTGAIVRTYPVGTAPEGITFDGANIWVTDTVNNTVTKISAGNPSAAPSIASISPTSSAAGAAGLTLAVNGSGFVTDDIVVWSAASATPLVTTWVNSALLSAQVPAGLLSVAETAQITVTGPSSLSSNAATFVVTSTSAIAPAIASLSPPSATAGSPALFITVSGSGFASGDLVLWNGLTLATTYASPTTLTAQIPAGELANQGSGQMVVANPNGGESNALAFTVASPAGGVSIASGGVVNSASSLAQISPGSIFSVYGNNLSSGTAGLFSAPLPTSSNGTAVTVNGIPAPLLYVSPTMIDAQVPVNAGGGSALVVVSYNGTSDSASVPIAGASPGFFFSTANGVNFAIGEHADYSLITPANPAQSGEIVSFYGTGIGPVNPSPASGQAAGYPKLSVSNSIYSVTVNGENAPVTYIGLTPYLVGLMQVNIQIPHMPISENVPLVAYIGGGRTQADLSIPVMAISPATTYTFQFSATTLTGQEAVSYTAPAPTAPGSASLNIASGSPYSQTGSRGTDGSWTFSNSQDPSGLLFGAVLYYTWTAATTTAFPNTPGTYSGIPATATVTCNTGAGSACIGGIAFGFLKVGTASGTVTITIR